jgi:hypothetical protein
MAWHDIFAAAQQVPAPRRSAPCIYKRLDAALASLTLTLNHFPSLSRNSRLALSL